MHATRGWRGGNSRIAANGRRPIRNASRLTIQQHEVNALTEPWGRWRTQSNSKERVRRRKLWVQEVENVWATFVDACLVAIVGGIGGVSGQIRSRPGNP